MLNMSINNNKSDPFTTNSRFKGETLSCFCLQIVCMYVQSMSRYFCGIYIPLSLQTKINKYNIHINMY